jgi:hypothetical protein
MGRFCTSADEESATIGALDDSAMAAAAFRIRRLPLFTTFFLPIDQNRRARFRSPLPVHNPERRRRVVRGVILGASQREEASMIYELRVYHAMPGKLPALVDRFRKTTVRIWAKYDIRPMGFWTVDIGESTNDLYYLLQWDDLSHRERSTAAFQKDTEWIAARDQSEAAGPLIASMTRSILQPTDFSKMR